MDDFWPLWRDLHRLRRYYVFSDQPPENAETVFITFCQVLFNPWVSGFLLAAVLAAIMSTVDPQPLLCSNALTENFYCSFVRREASQQELVWVSRLSVVGIALLATVLAMNPDSRVLDLVSYAWAGFGAAFGPVIILSLYWRGMTRDGAAAGLIVGAVTVVVWKQISGGNFDLYEIVPGFVLCWIAVVVVSRMSQPHDKVVACFDRALAASASPDKPIISA